MNNTHFQIENICFAQVSSILLQYALQLQMRALSNELACLSENPVQQEDGLQFPFTLSSPVGNGL